jgi:hypothetical protein
MLSVLRAQQCQVIYVGDPYQQIYEWRGAVNAMDHIRAPECALTESFRFGPAIAQLASRVLALMDEDTPVRGQDQSLPRILHESAGQDRDAVLCRKNATVLTHLAQGIGRGDRVAVRANVDELRAFADGAEQLMRGQRIGIRPPSPSSRRGKRCRSTQSLSLAGSQAAGHADRQRGWTTCG